MIQHIYPIGDLKEHETDGKPCWCRPEEEVVGLTGLLIIHNSADGREAYEKGERKVS